MIELKDRPRARPPLTLPPASATFWPWFLLFGASLTLLSIACVLRNEPLFGIAAGLFMAWAWRTR